MKKPLAFAGLLAAFVSASAFAQPPVAYLGIYFDMQHSINCAYPPAGTLTTCWLWCLPGLDGVKMVTFSVQASSNVILLSTQISPLDACTIMQCQECCQNEAYLQNCQFGPFWLRAVQFMAMDTNPARIDIGPHPSLGACQAASCLPGYPMEDCVILTHGYLNTNPCPSVGVESSTWGSIKSLYR